MIAVTDSMGLTCARGTAWPDLLGIPVDGDWQRTTRYLRSRRYIGQGVIIIQLGIVDCAPRAFPLADISRKGRRHHLTALGFDVAAVRTNDLQRWVQRHRADVLAAVAATGGLRCYVAPPESARNLAAFVARHGAARIVFILPVKPLEHDEALYHFGASELIEDFCAAVRCVPRVEFVDLNADPTFSERKERLMIPYDTGNEDGYHLNQDGQSYLATTIRSLL